MTTYFRSWQIILAFHHITQEDLKMTPISTEEKSRLKGLGFITNKNTDCFSARVITGNGRLSEEEITHIAKAAGKYGDGHIVLTTRLSIEIPGIAYENIEPFTEYLNQGGFETGGTGPKVRPIVCCKGTTCQYGLLDSYGLAKKIHERFYLGYHDVVLPHKFKIAVGGCPNNCVKPTLNDVGIMGWRNGYKMFIGGRFGKSHAIGQPLSHIFEDEESLLNAIENAILIFKEHGKKGERFSATIERLGFETVEKLILSE